MNGDKQNQDVGERGFALQAGGSIVYNEGITPSEAIAIFHELVRGQFNDLTTKAEAVARVRAHEVATEFFEKLKTDNPDGIKKAEDPDFQHAFIAVQRAHARIGDADLGGLLVNLLVERSKQGSRNVLQIVLNESLETVPKLTESHIAVLSFMFMFRHSRWQNLHRANHFGAFLDTRIAPLLPGIPKGASNYQHLQFTGCAVAELGTISLESILLQQYPALFAKGFEAREISDRNILVGHRASIFCQCLNEPRKLQISFDTQDEMTSYFDSNAIPESDRNHIVELFNINRMSIEEVRAKCVEFRPYMTMAFESWNATAIGKLSLTSVGISIGHAKQKQLVPDTTHLSEWIN